MQYNPNTGPYNLNNALPPHRSEMAAVLDRVDTATIDHNGNARDENTGEYLPRRPIVGDSVRVNEGRSKAGEIGVIDLDDHSPRLPFRVKFTDDLGWYGPDDLTVVPPAPVAPVGADSVAEEVTHLRETLADVRSQLSRALAAHRTDIALIGEALLHEAEEREWCGEYDEVVENLNRRLSVELPLRKRTTTLQITDEDGYGRYTLEVNDTDEDQAVSDLVDAVENDAPQEWTYHIRDENGSRLQSVTVHAESEADGARIVLDAARNNLDLADWAG